MKINNNLNEYQFGVHDKEQRNVSRNSNSDLGKDAFLHLLTTQLANQDPLDPMDDREFIAQLAQFSSLEQMNNLNEKASEMINAIDFMTLNQIEADVATLEEIVKIREGLEEYLGIDLDDIEKPDTENPDIENPDIENPDTENPEVEETEDNKSNNNRIYKNNTDINQELRSRFMEYRLKK